MTKAPPQRLHLAFGGKPVDPSRSGNAVRLCHEEAASSATGNLGT